MKKKKDRWQSFNLDKKKIKQANPRVVLCGWILQNLKNDTNYKNPDLFPNYPFWLNRKKTMAWKSQIMFIHIWESKCVCKPEYCNTISIYLILKVYVSKKINNKYIFVLFSYFLCSLALALSPWGRVVMI